MEYRQLGTTGIRVSALCLGTMTWGQQNDQQDAFEQLDYATGHGINFIDTAEMYPVPPTADTYTLTETYLGNWLRQRGHHDDLVIASKICGPGYDYMDGGRCMTAEHIHKAVEGSLQRLGVDCIDLYQLHWPDRNVNIFGRLGYTHEPDQDGTPVEETLNALQILVNQGKIRHYGLSNETPWGAMEHLRISREQSFPRAASIQNPYNLLNRTFEVGLAEISHREHLGLLAYSPMAFGVLSGKYLNGARPEKARLTLYKRFTRYQSAQSQAATAAYVKLAYGSGLDPAQMALAFVTSRSFVTSNIIGATTLEQLRSNIQSNELQLSDDTLRAIDDIHQQYSNPAP